MFSPQIGVVALAGSSDVGKSSLLRQLATSIVYEQKDFLGFPINAKHRGVIYVSTEDDAQAVSFLLNKQKPADKEAEDLRGLRFVFESDELIEKVEVELKDQAADCVIIDTFTDTYGGDLNASNKVRSYLNGFSVLASRYKCLFIFLHHTGKKEDIYHHQRIIF